MCSEGSTTLSQSAARPAISIDRAGYPFILGALLLAVACMVFDWQVAGAAFMVLAGMFGFFFRDPQRTVPGGDRMVVAPADGRVIHAGPADSGTAPDGDWLQVSVFLSPLDVHVNRTPVAGRVVAVEHRAGRFLPAYRAESGGVNERSEIRIEGDGCMIIVRQVVGVLARRVVCRLTPGMTVERGARLGIMKFGSRMDVFLPGDAELRVQVPARVRGGETIIAALPPAVEANARSV